MKISHAEFESCRRNPKQWVTTKLFGGGGGFSYGYGQALRGAIYTYHSTNNPATGRVYLNEKMKGFKNATRIQECKLGLKTYLDWAASSGVVVASCRVRLNQILHRDVALGGEISRVDINLRNDGYMAIILGNRSADWRNELRFPLIQYAIAEQFKRPLSLVRVGYQNLDGSDLETIQFSVSDIEMAVDEGRRVGKVVYAEAAKQASDL